jgi:predicted nucleic acid-binding protein
MLDTTVLCGALLTNGVNYKLLKAASIGIYQPVISNVCLLEFIRNASNGFKVKGMVKSFDWDTIDSFLEGLIFPALQEEEATNSVVSRNSYEVIKRLTKRPHISIGQALIEIVDLTDEQVRQIIQQQRMKLPLEQYDDKDCHVWSTALKTGCQYIVTRNTDRFPEQIGPILRIDPVDFYESLLDG